MDQEKMTAFKRRDPLALLRNDLIERQISTQAELDAIEIRARAESDAAIAAAKLKPWPSKESAHVGAFV